MAFTDAETVADPGAARRIHHFGLSPGVLHDADVADPHAMRKSGAHSLDYGFLGGKPHRQKPHRARRALELRTLFRHQQMRNEPFAVLHEHALHAVHLEHIDANAVNHRAARINSFMSRTALDKPSKRARDTIECPMFNSTISRIAAMG